MDGTNLLSYFVYSYSNEKIITSSHPDCLAGFCAVLLRLTLLLLHLVTYLSYIPVFGDDVSAALTDCVLMQLSTRSINQP